MKPLAANRRANPPARGKKRLIATALAAGCLAAAALLVPGCYIGNQGQDPPTNRLYFPTGLVTSPGRTALYIANSDFDLQFNGGTVVAFDLGRMRDRVLKPLLAGLVAGMGAAACAKPNLDLGPLPEGKRYRETFNQVNDQLDPNPGGAGSGETESGFSLLYPGPCSAVNSETLIGPGSPRSAPSRRASLSRSSRAALAALGSSCRCAAIPP